MKILLTGASGFVGRVLLRRLRAAGHEVVGLCHAQRGDASLVPCDLAQPLTLGGTFDVIVHAAGLSPAQTSSALAFKHANVDSMEQLLAWARAGHARRMIFLSSVSVYGDIRADCIDEMTPIVHPDDYGLTKWFAERLLEDSGIEGLVLRMPGVFGIRAERPWLARVVERCLRGEDVTIYSPAFVSNNYLYVEDLAAFIAQMLDAAWRERTLLLGLAQGVTIREAVELVRRTVGSSSRIVEKESAMQPFTLDIRRALAAGFAPHDFTSMIGGCLYGGGGGSTPDALSTAIDEVAA